MCPDNKLNRYLVRLENSRSYTPKDTVSILIKMRKDADRLGSVVKNLRITGKAIEFDLFASDSSKKDDTIAKLETEFGQKLSEKYLLIDAEKNLPVSVKEKERIVRESMDLFNEERFWECHESLEQIWRVEPKGQEKDLQQGIILAASALVHHQKNEDSICLGMIPRALAKLDKWKDGSYYSIDIRRLKDELRLLEKNGAIRLFKI